MDSLETSSPHGYAEACYAIARLLNDDSNLPVVLGGINGILKAIMPAENMFVSVLEGPDQIRFPYFADQIEKEDPLRIYKKEGLTGYIIDTGETFWIRHDQSLLKGVDFIGPVPVDWIGCPLKDKRGKAFGVFTVQSYEAGKVYADGDRDFLEFVAGAISVMIQSRNVERELAISKIVALVDEISDIEDMYPKLHEILKPVLPAARKSLVIVLTNEAKGVFTPVYWQDEKDDYTDCHWPLENGLCGYIYNYSRESFIYQDKITPIPAEAITNIGVQPAYWLGVPLFIGSRVIGIVYTQTHVASEVITKEDEATLMALAPHIASAINRAKFHGYYVS